ncbi:MAG: hypothetical protein AB7P00_38950, partial [Sandaracinaceae bacterium]
MIRSSILALALLAAAPALAQPAHRAMRLEVTPAACVDEARVREAVASHLGYDPFVDDAARGVTVAASVEEDGALLVIVVAVDAEEPNEASRRELSSPVSQCDTLLDVAGLSIAIAIDPTLVDPAPEPVPEPSPEPSPEPTPEAPVPEPSPEPAPDPGPAVSGAL